MLMHYRQEFQSPSQVINAFGQQPLTLTPGNNVVDAVSFSLVPLGVGPGDTTPSAVCVLIEDAADRQTELFVR